MNRLADLKTALFELLKQIDGSDIELIIGGGFGIFLKSDYVLNSSLPTLLGEWPEPRSTNDLDLFLRPELLINTEELKPLQAALAELKFKIVPGAEKYQFSRTGSSGTDSGVIKIDFLTGPRTSFAGSRVKVGERRARPNPSVDIHAHIMDEAPTLEEYTTEVPVTGTLDSGETRTMNISVPHPLTFSMMKLFAFRDRLNDSDKDFGQYHALDLYTIIASTTEEEWNQGSSLIEKYKTNDQVIEAGRIVSEFFSDSDGLGIIRLKESPYYRDSLQIDDFMSNLQELFSH